MITPRIKALFEYIEFLHSNIDNFKQYDKIISEISLLNNERNKLNPRKAFTDKLKENELQKKVKNKFKIINENIIIPIKTKAIELNICDPNKCETLLNWNVSEIFDLKENFEKDDIPKILKHKNKYIEFRTKTSHSYFTDIFDNLDETLKELFDFFKESEHNEFESFETKTIHAKDIRDAVDYILNKKSMQDKKIRTFALDRLKQNNVEDFFEKEYINWLLINSHEVQINGTIIEKGINRELLKITGKINKNDIVEVSCTTKDNFPLTKEIFIDEELKKYKPLLKKSIGSTINRETNIKLKLYIDCLKNHKLKFNQQNIDTNIDFTQTDPEYYNNKIKQFDKLYKVEKISDSEFLKDRNFLKQVVTKGDVVQTNNTFKAPKEAFEYFRKYIAYTHFLYLVSEFLKKYYTWDKDAINQEIDKMNMFIENANNVDISQAMAHTCSFDINEHNYIKLTKGYFEKNNPKNWMLDCKLVYAKYVLFYDLLKEKQKGLTGTPQPNTKAKPKVEENLSKQITHCKRVEIAKAISEKYSSYKGKDFKILHEALLELDLFPRKGKRSTFFRCLKNEGYNINNPQMLEDIHFKKGCKSAKGEYVKSEDEKQRDVIIEYLKTIINNK